MIIIAIVTVASGLTTTIVLHYIDKYFDNKITQLETQLEIERNNLANAETTNTTLRREKKQKDDQLAENVTKIQNMQRDYDTKFEEIQRQHFENVQDTQRNNVAKVESMQRKIVTLTSKAASAGKSNVSVKANVTFLYIL